MTHDSTIVMYACSCRGCLQLLQIHCSVQSLVSGDFQTTTLLYTLQSSGIGCFPNDSKCMQTSDHVVCASFCTVSPVYVAQRERNHGTQVGTQVGRQVAKEIQYVGRYLYVHIKISKFLIRYWNAIVFPFKYLGGCHQRLHGQQSFCRSVSHTIVDVSSNRIQLYFHQR